MSDVSAFFSKLISLLRGEVSEEKYSAAVRAARSHAGGVAKAEKQKEQKATDPGRRYFLSEIQLDEGRTSGTVQIFPESGSYAHPWYGTLDLTPDFFTDIKTHFDEKIYQQDLPVIVNLEHEPVLSGAVGWISDLSVRTDPTDAHIQGMWATVQFNERGRTLVTGDQYRYFSSEFMDEWTDPGTSKVYRNLLVGGALTNRPFFKGMDPVALLSESKVYAFAELSPFVDDFDRVLEILSANPDSSIDELMTSLLKTDAESDDEQDEGANSDSHEESEEEQVTMGMTPEEALKFKEMGDNFAAMQRQLSEERTAREAAQEEAKKARETAEKLVRDQGRRELTEFVKANRLAFREDVDAAVTKLEAQKSVLSPDQWEDVLEDRRVIHARLSESEILEQKSQAGAPVKVSNVIEAAVATKMSAGKSRAIAMKEALLENPAAYAQEVRAQNRRAAQPE